MRSETYVPASIYRPFFMFLRENQSRDTIMIIEYKVVKAICACLSYLLLKTLISLVRKRYWSMTTLFYFAWSKIWIEQADTEMLQWWVNPSSPKWQAIFSWFVVWCRLWGDEEWHHTPPEPMSRVVLPMRYLNMRLNMANYNSLSSPDISSCFLLVSDIQCIPFTYHMSPRHKGTVAYIDMKESPHTSRYWITHERIHGNHINKTSITFVV